MSVPNPAIYLKDLTTELKRLSPDNRTINIVCHGHSVPSGYYATPYVNTFNAYPHLLHVGLKQNFPYAVINVIVTAIGGENSQTGAQRFEKDALCHKPDVVTIDYGLNDRGLGISDAEKAWRFMIEKALSKDISVILLTPTFDNTYLDETSEGFINLQNHAQLIRCLASEYEIGLADSFAEFEKYMQIGDLADLLCWQNHPNRKGHEIVTQELLRWFPAYHPQI